jgi:hypothetical protein
MFNREISITVCGETSEIVQQWTNRFVRFFRDTTTVQAKGSWLSENTQVVLHEDNAIVTHLFTHGPGENRHWTWNELNDLLEEYAFVAEQEAVLVKVTKVCAGLFPFANGGDTLAGMSSRLK